MLVFRNNPKAIVTQISPVETLGMQESTLRLIPVCIEPLTDPRPEFLQVKLINATPGVFEPAMDLICSSLVDWIAGRDCHRKLDSVFKRKKA